MWNISRNSKKKKEKEMLDKASPEKKRVLAQDPQPRIPLPGKEVPMTCGCENQQELWLSETEGS